MTAYSPRSPTRAAILEWVDAHRSDIVGHGAVSRAHPQREQAAARFRKSVPDVRGRDLRDLGCRVDVFTPLEVAGLTEHPAYWPGHDYTDRPNVVGVLSSQGRRERPGGRGRRAQVAPVHRSHRRRADRRPGTIRLVGWHGRGRQALRPRRQRHEGRHRGLPDGHALHPRAGPRAQRRSDPGDGGGRGVRRRARVARLPLPRLQRRPRDPARAEQHAGRAPRTAAGSSSASSPAPRGRAWISAPRSFATR